MSPRPERNPPADKEEGSPHPPPAATEGGVEAEVVEDEVDESVEKGVEKLQRSSRVMFSTGLLGGIEVGFGTVLYLVVLHETGSQLLGALAFSVGFIALFLAHSELFTEGFFFPVMAIFAKEGTVWQILRLWGMTLTGNFVGAWLLMWLVVTALPELDGTIAEEARHYVDAPLGWQSISLAVLGGGVITLMTRMQTGSKGDVAILAAAVSGALLEVGLELFHSVLSSIVIFGALHSGAEGVTYLGWLGFLWYVTIFNVLGGLVLVTAPRLLRTSAVPH